MFVPIVTLGILGVTLTALLRVLEIKGRGHGPAAAQGELNCMGPRRVGKVALARPTAIAQLTRATLPTRSSCEV